MKRILFETIFIILSFAFMLGMFAIAELLSQIITMNTIMLAVYVSIVVVVIYIIEN